ncbi:MAG: insulinase family protein [Salinivirgaceae bacterium]|nr:insulinase family protein [Salinivirgaceae bacterium]
MILFDRFTLDNGLQVIVHQDKTTPIVAVDLLYKVGARNENPERTGFAHLFEHLMFDGSKNISDFDNQLQLAGGECNAFTTNDLTNYYITLPKQNIETAFWLESDRMLELGITKEKLEIQKDVVIEEYNQRYLNKPYGDWMLIMRYLAYRVHPYMWPTIGKDPLEIKYASLDEVNSFFYNYYAPNNAILVVAGDVETEQIRQLANKWFGPIPRRDTHIAPLPAEPEQKVAQYLELKRNEPLNAIYRGYHMDGRMGKKYHTADLISDILSNGESSRLNQILVKQQKTFTNINAYVTGEIDPGLFIIEGKLSDGVSFEQAEASIDSVLESLWKEPIADNELTKVKNNIEVKKVVSEVNILNKAMNLAYCEMLGDANLINTEVEQYQAVTTADIAALAQELFCKNNCSTIHYKSAQTTRQ